MTSLEISEWIEFYRIEPWDLIPQSQLSLITATLLNLNRQSESDKVYQPQDFMWWIDKPVTSVISTRNDSDDDIYSMAEMINDAINHNL